MCVPAGYAAYINGKLFGGKCRVLGRVTVNPSDAEATFVKSTRMQNIFENQLNPVILVFIG